MIGDAERRVFEALRFAMRMWSIGLGALAVTFVASSLVGGDEPSPLTWLGVATIAALFFGAAVAERGLRRGLAGDRVQLTRGMAAVAVWTGALSVALLASVVLSQMTALLGGES